MNTRDGGTEPTVEEVLAEAERRRRARGLTAGDRTRKKRRLSATERRLVTVADRFIYWFARHWLAVFNVVAFAYVAVPFLPPLLMRAGLPGPAQIIYALYGPLCHQLPYRSWFLFGLQPTYTAGELGRLVGAEALVQHGYVGDAMLGYKVALCQRDTAIYGTIFLAGLVYGLLRRRGRVRPLPLWAYILFGVIPIAFDGGIQFVTAILAWYAPTLGIGVVESTPLRRVITGALFGLATAWLAYPLIEQEVGSEVLATLERRFGGER